MINSMENKAIYSNAYSEVLEVLKHMSKEEYNKVPNKMIEMFNKNKNIDNCFKYDLNKNFKEQDISEKAKYILAILFRDYWTTEGQRKRIVAKQNKDRIVIEKVKKEKYNKLFKTTDMNDSKSSDYKKQENIQMIEYRKPFLKRIMSYIKRIFTSK